jgi:hypothetical protein
LSTLSLFGSAVQQPLDYRQESEISHVVGFIEHSDFNGFQADDLLLHEVFKPAGASNNNVHACLQRLFLALLGNATVNNGGGQAQFLRERLNHVVDLRGQFAGGCQDQAQRAVGLAAVCRFGFCKPRNQRKGKCEGLAGAGAAAAEHVTALEGIGKGFHLNRECFVNSGSGEGGNQCLGHTKGSKSSH